MRYGLLRVTRADGRTLDLPIDLPSVTVGRAPENGVVIPDPSVSKRHARLVIDSGRMLVEDLGSTVGTYINGQRIPPRHPSLVEPGQWLRFGGVDAAYFEAPPPASQQPSAPAGGAGFAPAAAAIPAAGGFAPRAPTPAAAPLPPIPSSPNSPIRLSLSALEGPVEAGQTAFLTASVQNRGRVVDQMTISVAELPPGWATVNTPSFALLPGAREDVTIVLSAPRTPASRAGTYIFTVVAASASTGIQEAARGNFVVLPFEAVSVSLAPVQTAKAFRVNGRNDGNLPATLQLRGMDDAEEIAFDFDAPAMHLEPGHEATVRGQVRTQNRPLFGQQQVKQFKVVAANADDPRKVVEAQGTLVIAPPLEKFKRPVLGFLLLCVVAGAALAAFFLLQGKDDDDSKKTGSTDTPVATAPPGSTPTAVPTPTPNQTALDGIFACQPPAGVTPAPPPPAGSPQLFQQNDARWASAVYAKADNPRAACGSSIAQCGCAMTSATNVLTLFNQLTMPDRQPLTPKTVNDFFNLDAKRTGAGWVSRGYVFNGINWFAVTELSNTIAAAQPGGNRVAYVPVWGSGSPEEIRRELQANRPVILELAVKTATYTGPHFILAYALQGNTILVNDPSHPGQRTLEPYMGTIKSSRLFRVVDPANPGLDALVVTVPAGMRVLITDKDGKTVGTTSGATPEDAQRMAKVDIPGSVYTYQEAWRDPTCMERAPQPGTGTHQIFIPSPDGKYHVRVVSAGPGGTAVGIHVYDDKGKAETTGIENPGQTDIDIEIQRPATPTPPPGATTPAGGSPPGGRPTTAVATTALATTVTRPPTTAAPTTVTAAPTTPAPSPSSAAITCTGSKASLTAGGFRVQIDCNATVGGQSTSSKWTIDGTEVSTPANSRTMTQARNVTSTAAYRVEFTVCNGTSCRPPVPKIVDCTQTPAGAPNTSCLVRDP